MKKFLEFTTSFFFIVFCVITFLVLFHEPPTGPADEPYIEYNNFWSNWGKIILIIWGGSLVTFIVGMMVMPKQK